jgi:hypothetical protein
MAKGRLLTRRVWRNSARPGVSSLIATAIATISGRTSNSSAVPRTRSSVRLATGVQRPPAAFSAPSWRDDRAGTDGFAGIRAGRSAGGMPTRTVARFGLPGIQVRKGHPP